MTIIRLNEEGFPLKVRSTFPAAMVGAHVAVLTFVAVMAVLS